jgi:hypothetical protein
MSQTLEILYVPDCPNLAPMLAHLRQVTDLPIATHEISTTSDAAAAGMSGSPTLLVNGVDVFADRGQPADGPACRIYRDEHGAVVPVPSVAQLRQALATAELTAWRDRAHPHDLAEQAVHRAILRAFVDTGRPPVHRDLDPVTEGSGRSTTEILAALHDLDAIRLDRAGRIAVAYPFSATPTRHRVWIGGGVVVYAMCAVDALGIAATLGGPTRIESADATTGQPIAVTMAAGRTSWSPAAAVVFLSAKAGSGPSATCCCDDVNFFADETTARNWAAHQEFSGQILTQADAEALGTRLFGTLLAPASHPATYQG